jgi:hypothetical protein
MTHRVFIGQSQKGGPTHINRRLRRTRRSLSGTSLALLLGLTGGCDPEPVPEPEPPCTFHSEFQVADGEFTREPGDPWHQATFDTEEGDYAIEFQLERMPAAEAIIDGEKLNLSAGVSVRDEVVQRVEVHLSAGLHQLSLRVAGPPGGTLRYSIARIITSDQPAITDTFTVYQGESSAHTLCGGPSYITFDRNALQLADEELDVTVRCEAVACAEGGNELASPRLVFETPDGGYQFRSPPVLVHATTPNSIRELDGVPIASEVVGTAVVNGVEKQLVLSRVPHFSTVEDRDLGPWCDSELSQLGVPASDVCYTSDNEPGMQYLARCQNSEGEVTASNVTPCGLGPDACMVGVNANDYCNPVAVDCEVRATAALEINPCPPLPDDTIGSEAHSLRCDEFTNQVFVGVTNTETGQCELRGQDLLTRDQQVKTVLAATFGPRFMEGIEWYLATHEECANRDFSEFDDYSSWAEIWSTNILKFAICEDILQGRGLPEDPETSLIAAGEPVLEAEMAAIMVRSGGLDALVLPDNTLLEPNARMVDLHERHTQLVDKTNQPLVGLANQDCPQEAWFFSESDPVLQVIADEGVTCQVHATGWMTRSETAEWLYNLIFQSASCEGDQVEVSCDDSGYPISPQACTPCNSESTCKDMIGSVMSTFPDYAVAGVTLDFIAGGATTYCDGFTVGAIRCPKHWVNGGSTITNKVLFHEINHKLTWGAAGKKHDYSGVCNSGNCNSSEFQASLLEDFYFPATCSGGNYKFTDTKNKVRRSKDIIEILLQPEPISESGLWDYAMGRSDTLAPYMDRFGLDHTFQLFYSQTAK